MTKKLVLSASAVAFAAAMSMAMVGQVQAAANSPFCNLAKSQKNPVAWNAYYHCLGPAPRPQHVVRERRGPAKSPFCKLASSQKNLVAWNAYYHCL